MKLDLPINSAPSEDFSDKFFKQVKDEVDYLDKHYDSVYPLLKDAMTSAMSWAPQAVMSKQIPDAQKLYNLAVQLLTVCYCTERNIGKSGQGTR